MKQRFILDANAVRILLERRAALVADLLLVWPIEHFDAKVAVTYGRLRAELQRLGSALRRWTLPMPWRSIVPW